MITGKKGRENFVPLSIHSFLDQTEYNKHLIIVNHGEKSVYDLYTLAKNNTITEIRVDKDCSLGELKNLGLTYIPDDSLFCPWDDDDVRSRYFLKYLRSQLVFPYSAVFIKNRYEYNSNNDFCYRSSFSYGMPVFIAFKNKNWKYKEVDALEDIDLQKDLHNLGKMYTSIDNNPFLYIRVIHKNNTSPYVKENKDSINLYPAESSYREYSTNKQEKKKIKQMIDLNKGFSVN